MQAPVLSGIDPTDPADREVIVLVAGLKATGMDETRIIASLFRVALRGQVAQKGRRQVAAMLKRLAADVKAGRFDPIGLPPPAARAA